MINNKNKILGGIPLVCSLFSVQALADIQIVGSESETTQFVADHYSQAVQYYNGSLKETDLLYINMGTATEDEIDIVKSSIVKGITTVIDLTAIASNDDRTEQSRNLTGLGVAAPVVVTGFYDDEIIINAIVSNVTDENGNPLNNLQAEQESINQSLAFALDRLSFGGK